ncbi:MAG: hypothetical protein RLZZ618_3756 [Pseudomonadota bacterium]
MTLKRFFASLSLVVLSLALVAPQVAEAKRFGGGGSSGMRRDLPARNTPDATPAKPTTPPAAAPGAAAATPKRSWMGPLAGLAAGLGLATLMSHLGLGGAFGNILLLVILLGIGFFVIRFLMRRFGPKPAMQFAGGPAGNFAPPASPWGGAGAGFGAAAATTAAHAAIATPVSLPPDFDAPAFERAAKLIFLRMQTANDAADLNDLRQFTTPEMYAVAKLELQDRPPGPQQTDVVRVDAEVMDVAQDTHQQIVSVRFHGRIREDQNGEVMDFDEIWHLVRPHDGSREWAISGIQ